ncbi:unnamed protein product [Diatraea saccharalis]|uniref:Ig-like domain-containing protein n=1 Tax=Diatraea saccharalis TaxID=40085 RepID=A0A9N9QVC4_9NEOP|nr:unnamed protein product [Diatraea saccharalis]
MQRYAKGEGRKDGNDADSTSTFPDEIHNQENGIQPTVNVVYQMLHSTEHNQTELNSILNVNELKDTKCCDYNYKMNVVGDTGATKITEVKNKNDRIKRIVKMERTNDFNDDTEISTTTSVVNPTFIHEKRRKPGETGSSAPLLNYIFDTYTNTHQHRNGKVSPGNSIYAAAAPEIEALVGSTAHLDCKVDSLHDKLVSWVRRKNDEEPMELLTTGTQQYTADDRYSARFIPPDIWRLEVKEVRPSDAAHYDCQLSAHPPRTARVTLHVPEVSVRIVDGAGADVSEQVCEIGSTVALRCEVREAIPEYQRKLDNCKKRIASKSLHEFYKFFYRYYELLEELRSRLFQIEAFLSSRVRFPIHSM